VSTRGTAVTRYLGESTSRLRASWSRRAWATHALAGAMGATARITAKKGAAVAFTVTARGFALVLGHGAKYGSVAVYVDGHRVRTLSLRANRTGVSVALTRMFASSGRHTVRIVNLTGGRRGTVGFDGIVTIA
jgi:hypothetical protein